MSIVDLFGSVAFMLIAISTQAIMQTFGRLTTALHPEWYQHKWFKAFVTSQNVLWGIVLSFVVNLNRLPFGERVLTGMVAGFLSLFIYEVALKRIKATSTAPPEKEC